MVHEHPESDLLSPRPMRAPFLEIRRVGALHEQQHSVSYTDMADIEEHAIFLAGGEQRMILHNEVILPTCEVAFACGQAPDDGR